MSKILIVDDDTAILELIKVNLELLGHEAITASDGVRGFALARQELPDLIILDVMMPDVDGFTVASRIRNNPSTKDIPILMLTALSMIQDKTKGFDAGVDDYLVKPFDLDELKLRVRALLRRVNAIPESLGKGEILTVGDMTLLPENLSVQIKDKTAKLTPIEYEILSMLMQNHGNAVTASVLLKDIWGYSPDDDIETIRVHIRHLRTKLQKISPDKKYIETIYGGGYRLVTDED